MKVSINRLTDIVNLSELFIITSSIKNIVPYLLFLVQSCCFLVIHGVFVHFPPFCSGAA